MKVYIMKIESLCEINFGFFYLIKKNTTSSHHFYLSYITMKENLIMVCRTISTLALLFKKNQIQRHLHEQVLQEPTFKVS